MLNSHTQYLHLTCFSSSSFFFLLFLIDNLTHTHTHKTKISIEIYWVDGIVFILKYKVIHDKFLRVLLLLLLLLAVVVVFSN
jgi:hypothetical protein